MVMQASRSFAHVHGGPDRLGAPLHDFSTNSNGCGPCPEALAAVRAADPTRYPDPAYTELRAGLAAFHGWLCSVSCRPRAAASSSCA